MIQQQAKYAARLEKDEQRFARLEESFTILVELVRGTDERLDQDAARFERDESRLARLEESFKMLVELARGADERLDQNAARLERDESRLARLEESFTMVVELARGMDERLKTLCETTATLSHTITEFVQRTTTAETRVVMLQ